MLRSHAGRQYVTRRRTVNVVGNVVGRARMAAAIRARDEIVARLEVTPEELRATAEALGYSLGPERCGNRCENVARLARIELEKQALQRFVSGGPSPG